MKCTECPNFNECLNDGHWRHCGKGQYDCYIHNPCDICEETKTCRMKVAYEAGNDSLTNVIIETVKEIYPYTFKLKSGFEAVIDTASKTYHIDLFCHRAVKYMTRVRRFLGLSPKQRIKKIIFGRISSFPNHINNELFEKATKEEFDDWSGEKEYFYNPYTVIRIINKTPSCTIERIRTNSNSDANSDSDENKFIELLKKRLEKQGRKVKLL